MHEEMIEKLDILKDLVGSRVGYFETVKMLELNQEERDIFMRASLEVNKNQPKFEIIDKAYTILVSKNFQLENTANNDVAAKELTNEFTSNSTTSYSETEINTIDWMKIAKTIFAIVIVAIVYYALTITTKISTPDISAPQERTIEVGLSCDNESIEKTVKKLARDTAESMLWKIGTRDAHISTEEFTNILKSFNNITHITLTSVYPTNINRELNIIECRGDVDIYTTILRNIPISIKYRAQYNEYGQGYVEITDFRFRNKYFY